MIYSGCMMFNPKVVWNPSTHINFTLRSADTVYFLYSGGNTIFCEKILPNMGFELTTSGS